MGKAEYFIVVCPGYGRGHNEFDIDYLFTENLIKRFREGRTHDTVYLCHIVPEAVPHAVRLLKERRSRYSMYYGKAESFYLCFETWAGFQSPTGEARRLSDPERVKAMESELKQYSKASLKRLDEMYAALKKADEETLNSVALFRVAVCDTIGAEEPQKELIFTLGGIWFISADELRGYTREDQQAFLTDLVDDPAKVVLDPLTEAVFRAVADAERPFLLLDDGGEDRTETAEGIPLDLKEEDRKIFLEMLRYADEIKSGEQTIHFERPEPSFRTQAGDPLMTEGGYNLGKANKLNPRYWIRLKGKGKDKPYFVLKNKFLKQLIKNLH